MTLLEVDVLGLDVDDALVLSVVRVRRDLVALGLSLELHLLVLLQSVHGALVEKLALLRLRLQQILFLEDVVFDFDRLVIDVLLASEALRRLGLTILVASLNEIVEVGRHFLQAL